MIQFRKGGLDAISSCSDNSTNNCVVVNERIKRAVKKVNSHRADATEIVDKDT